MRNFKNNKRRFRNNSFDRGLKINSNDQSYNSTFGNVSEIKRKNYTRNNFNSTKLIQKYSDLAREALSSGDKILHENYLQHAEHFIRISLNNSQENNHKNGSANTDELKDTNVKKISQENINTESRTSEKDN